MSVASGRTIVTDGSGTGAGDHYNPGMTEPDRELVRSTARLARLQIDEGEVESLAADFARILDSFRDLAEVDVSDTEPMLSATELRNVLRPDEPRPSLAREDVLSSAPRRRDDYFGVPKTVEGS